MRHGISLPFSEDGANGPVNTPFVSEIKESKIYLYRAWRVQYQVPNNIQRKQFIPLFLNC